MYQHICKLTVIRCIILYRSFYGKGFFSSKGVFWDFEYLTIRCAGCMEMVPWGRHGVSGVRFRALFVCSFSKAQFAQKMRLQKMLPQRHRMQKTVSCQKSFAEKRERGKG